MGKEEALSQLSGKRAEARAAGGLVYRWEGR